MIQAEKIILALDVENKESAEKIVDQLPWGPKIVKVGMELFYKEGHSIINYLQKRQLKVFLDLKLHDIPNTVGRSIKQLANLGVNMLTIHTMGGWEMMARARESISSSDEKSRPLLLGVTQLTSISQQILNDELKINRNIEELVLDLALLAHKADLDGVICSPLEVPLLRKKLPSDFLLVTPGVRVKKMIQQDQKRVTSPREAFANGADFIVVGREVTQAPIPEQSWHELVESLR